LDCSQFLFIEDKFVMELKGLDIVRRDWAPVGANTARYGINFLQNYLSIEN